MFHNQQTRTSSLAPLAEFPSRSSLDNVLISEDPAPSSRRLVRPGCATVTKKVVSANQFLSLEATQSVEAPAAESVRAASPLVPPGLAAQGLSGNSPVNNHFPYPLATMIMSAQTASTPHYTSGPPFTGAPNTPTVAGGCRSFNPSPLFGTDPCSPTTGTVTSVAAPSHPFVVFPKISSPTGVELKKSTSAGKLRACTPTTAPLVPTVIQITVAGRPVTPPELQGTVIRPTTPASTPAPSATRETREHQADLLTMEGTEVLSAFIVQPVRQSLRFRVNDPYAAKVIADQFIAEIVGEEAAHAASLNYANELERLTEYWPVFPSPNLPDESQTEGRSLSPLDDPTHSVLPSLDTFAVSMIKADSVYFDSSYPSSRASTCGASTVGGGISSAEVTPVKERTNRKVPAQDQADSGKGSLGVDEPTSQMFEPAAGSCETSPQRKAKVTQPSAKKKERKERVAKPERSAGQCMTPTPLANAAGHSSTPDTLTQRTMTEGLPKTPGNKIQQRQYINGRPVMVWVSVA